MIGVRLYLALFSLLLLSFPFLCLCDSTSARAGLYPVKIATSVVATTFLRQTTAAYAVEHTFTATTTQLSSSADLLTAQLAGEYDFTVATAALTSSQLQATPDQYYFPLLGNAIVPVYNLPDSAGATKLILPVQSVCDILRGNITNWSDPRLQAANPSLTMPNLAITVYLFSIVTPNNDLVTGLCGKTDPIFMSEIPRSSGPTWPFGKYAASGTAQNSDVLSSLVVDTLGGFTMVTLQNALSIKADVASMQNSAGIVLTPTINSISLNLLELAVKSIEKGATNHDLTAPVSPNAWPVCSLTYLIINTADPVTTCATKRSVLNYLLWLYSDSSVKLLAEDLNIAIVPDLFTSQTGLLADLQTRITCQGSTLITSSDDQGTVEGFNAGSQLLGAIFNYYNGIDNGRTYDFSATTERLATQRVVAGEIDLALVNTLQLEAADTDLMTLAGGFYIPAFYTGVAVTFTLPTAISSKWASWTAASGLPSLYPLSLDLETVAQIFTGQITSWLDSRILATSPQLSSWFAAYPTANPLFTVLVCCSLSSESPVAGLLLMQNLNQTTTAMDPKYAPLFLTPLSFTQQVSAYSSFTMLDIEARMPAKATSIAGVGSSTISYRLMTNAATDPLTEFQIVQVVNGVNEYVKPEPANFRTCTQAGWDAGTLHLTTFTLPPTTACYPLGSPLALGVNLVYEDDQCTRGNKSLNLFSWIVNTNALSDASMNAGAFRIADVTDVYTATMSGLNAATCDGETLLITLPKVWEVNAAINGLGWASLAIWGSVLAVSAVLLYMYRTRTVLRSSSVPFLGVTLLGMAMLAGAVPAWSTAPTDSSCGAFMWLAPLGFSLVFVPFFAKTYRIWAIFSRKQLKVIKMSNKKLMVGVGALIAIEMMLLILWSQFDPLQPVQYLRNVSGRMHQATHCSVKGNGMTFVVIEAVYKGLLLLAGTLLAFSTRKVSSAFNESSAIAWSIYNVLFSSVIVGAIVYFVDAFEDTLILLFVFLIGWVVLVTWGLLFGAKFYSLFSQTEADAALASKISSMHTEKSAGFSFISVLTMPTNMLKSYVTALEGQLAKARKQLTAALGTSGQGLGIGVGNKNRLAPPKTSAAKYETSLPGQTSCLNDPDDGPVSPVTEAEPSEKDILAPNNNDNKEELQAVSPRSATVHNRAPSVTATAEPSLTRGVQRPQLQVNTKNSPSLGQQRRLLHSSSSSVQLASPSGAAGGGFGTLSLQTQAASSSSAVIDSDRDSPEPRSPNETNVIATANISSAMRPSSRATHQILLVNRKD